jgi:hypothetical protein
MATVGKRYRNDYTGKIVTVKAVESVRIGPGEKYVEVVVLNDGSRWENTGSASTAFYACHKPA